MAIKGAARPISINSIKVNQVTRKLKQPKCPSFHVKAGLFINHNPKIRPKRMDYGLFHGRGKMFGNMVSFAENKTRRSWDPNVHYIKLYSEALDARLKVKATSAAVNSVAKAGGLDNYLLNTKEKNLDSQFALFLKRFVQKAQKKNKDEKKRKEEIEWYAQRLVEEAQQDEKVKNLLLNPEDPTNVDDAEISPEDMEQRLKLDEARKAAAKEELKFLRQRARLVKGPKEMRRHSRYELTRHRIQVPEYKLQKDKIEELRNVDTVRWDLIHRGVLKYTRTKQSEVEQAKAIDSQPEKVSQNTAEEMLKAMSGRTDQDLPGKKNKLTPKDRYNLKKEKAAAKKK